MSVQKKFEVNKNQHHAGRCYECAKNSTLLKLPEEDKAHMMFNNNKNKLNRPYIVYADNDCSLVPTGLTDKTHKHFPNSACFYSVCDYDPIQNRLGYALGPKCIVNVCWLS